MTILAFAILVAVVATGWVIHPLVTRRYGLLVDLVSSDVLDRESRKRVTLASLKDAGYDHVTGKLDDADYQQLRVRLEREALDALAASDADVDSAPVPGGRAASGKASVHSCGYSNPPGSRYCAECGERLA